jgi:hypothetical protein
LITDPSLGTARPNLGDILERLALIVILLVVAYLAGKTAFGRVVDWTLANSPDTTPLFSGWTNGVISELLPVGVLLFIRHQKRHGRAPGLLAWSALLGSFAFSLTAQLAQAVPSVGGWTVAAVPSVAFGVLSKMVVSMRPAQPARDSPNVVGELAADAAPAAVQVANWEERRPPARVSNPETASPNAPELKAQPEPEPDKPSEPKPQAPLPNRVRARSLTSAVQVEMAVQELGPTAMPASIAARAGVSESTARRHMPKRVPSETAGVADHLVPAPV